MRQVLIRTCRTAALAVVAAVLIGGCGNGAAAPQAALARVTPAVAALAPTAGGNPAAAPTEATGATPTTGVKSKAAAAVAAVLGAAAPRPTAEPRPLGVGVAPDAPAAAIGPVLEAMAAAGIDAEQVTEQPDLRLILGSADGAVAAWEQVFTPVDRMSSVLQSITLEELKAVWTGAGTTPNFTNIYVGQDHVAPLTAPLGEPGANVKPMPTEGVEAAVWGDRMGLAIASFDSLTVKLRAIGVDGQSPVDNRFRADEWPLTSRASLVAVTERGRAALAGGVDGLPVTNRDAAKLTVLVMTGVTAMARNSAVAIDRSGDPGFLARVVGPELAAADLTIISNEIPFLPDCVANNTLNNLILCSHTDYWENLALSGVDAIGLSGNHQNDFGYEAMRQSLAFYEEKKAPTYGGGADDQAARAPLTLTQNGNRLGFLAANQWGPETYYNGAGEAVSAWAGAENPGSARFDLATMQADIRALKPQVDLVFAEVQHTEFNAAGDYQTEPIPLQESDFRGMIDAGADVVTGVMAHAPQAVEIRDGKLILYGLGNLYFDQTWSWPTRTGLVARHTIYDGKLINTELLVTVIETNFQLRWATPAERIQVLKSVFDVSRW